TTLFPLSLHDALPISLVGFPKELQLQIEVIHRVAAEVAREKKTKLNYIVGTMIEIPRAALVADEIAKEAEFFSFGTNDLTQTTRSEEHTSELQSLRHL